MQTVGLRHAHLVPFGRVTSGAGTTDRLDVAAAGADAFVRLPDLTSKPCHASRSEFQLPDDHLRRLGRHDRAAGTRARLPARNGHARRCAAYCAAFARQRSAAAAATRRSEPREASANEARALTITHARDDLAWSMGRAGMQYRDLIPGRLGGLAITSTSASPKGRRARSRALPRCAIPDDILPQGLGARGLRGSGAITDDARWRLRPAAATDPAPCAGSVAGAGSSRARVSCRSPHLDRP